MRVFDCNVCGETLTAATDDELVRCVCRHIEQQHPGETCEPDAVRAVLDRQAYEATDS
jgi:predicted small metal-binding protein